MKLIGKNLTNDLRNVQRPFGTLRKQAEDAGKTLTYVTGKAGAVLLPHCNRDCAKKCLYSLFLIHTTVTRLLIPVVDFGAWPVPRDG